MEEISRILTRGQRVNRAQMFTDYYHYHLFQKLLFKPWYNADVADMSLSVLNRMSEFKVRLT